MLTYLIVILAVRLTLVGGRIVLAPGAERFRLLPMSTPTARYWFLWSAVLVGAFYFAKGTFRLVPALGATPATRTLVGVVLSIILLGLALVALWRRPTLDGHRTSHRAYEGSTWLVSAYFVGGMVDCFQQRDGAVRHRSRSPSRRPGELRVAPRCRTPVAIVGTRGGRPDDAPARGRRLPSRASRCGVCRGALVVAYILDLDLTALAANDTAATRLARAVLDVVIILLIADFVWQMARVAIDRHLSGTTVGAMTGTDAEIRRRQRLRTLLPVLRNLLLVAVVAVAGLMALSTIGVDVGPLVAGAGIVGIAIGFGAQTLVKDVIAGMFFLFDDAFRVGEYIESGPIKGTVEAFSLRSIKLRHQRGALHTVPFGALTTITNQSRDWVIDKLSIGVTYDTDLDAVKRIVKEIGGVLQEDPEFSPHILETLKMQGVEQFGDFAIQVRLKMRTRPGEQFVIRRRAYALIKRAFEKQGIQFAYPTVTVAGDAGGATAAAAAKAGLDLAQA